MTKIWKVTFGNCFSDNIIAKNLKEAIMKAERHNKKLLEKLSSEDEDIEISKVELLFEADY